jgi:hypothetical protein
MYSHQLLKPDGRKLTLYSRYPISSELQATSPSNEPVQANPHLRWHPLRGEWVAYAKRPKNKIRYLKSCIFFVTNFSGYLWKISRNIWLLN